MSSPTQSKRRSLLFLQGNNSFLFSKLAGELERRNHRVVKICVCAADVMLWLPERSRYQFRGTMGDWPDFVERVLAAEKVSDILLFGDCRPYHSVAIQHARRMGVRVFVFDEGYLRPNWITFEEGGTNGHSNCPTDASELADKSGDLDDPVEAEYPRAFLQRVLIDLAANAANVLLNPLFFRFYERHRPNSSLKEAWGWSKRLMSKTIKPSLRVDKSKVSRYFLFPLQLDSDYQIRVHSPFQSMQEACETVLASFAKADPNVSLIVKEHPLDNHVRNYRAIVSTISRHMGIGQRVIYINSGNTTDLIDGCLGVVSVNSTFGLLALRAGKPVHCLGSAIYALPELVDRRSLEQFWTGPIPPDMKICHNLVKYICTNCQVSGSYFGRTAINAAISAIVDRIQSQ